MTVHMKPGAPRATEIHTRSTVLGEMHRGQMVMEERHPVLRYMVRAAIICNAIALLLLWLAFRIQNMFPPEEAPFMNAIGLYFLFGVVYGGFAQLLRSFGSYTENQAVMKSLTHNRRYEWHSHYDTKNMTAEDLRKVADTPFNHKQAGHAPGQNPLAVGAGARIFNYSALFVFCAFSSCALGVFMFFHTMW